MFLIATGGFYRSQDGGVSWQPIYSGFFNAPWDLAVDPADSSRVYVIAPNSPSLYVSTDGGSTLQPSATFPAAVSNAEAIALSHDGMTLYVRSANQLYRSTDRGQTWTQCTPFLSTSTIVERLLVDPTDSNTVYVVQANSRQLCPVRAAIVGHENEGYRCTDYTLSVNNAGPGASSQVNCSLNSVDVGKPVTVTIDATATAAGNQTSTATVASSAADPASANNSSSSTTVINAVATIDSPAPSKSGGGIVSLWDLVGLMLLWASHVRRTHTGWAWRQAPNN